MAWTTGAAETMNAAELESPPGAGFDATRLTVPAVASNVAVSRSVTNLAPGSLQLTGQALDFAVDGTGFFAVGTAQGVRYTRDGQFRASAAGLLVDAQGNPVLGTNRQPIRVAAGGTVPATALGVFNLTGAAKQGNNLFTGVVAGGPTGVVRQGALENSAVNAVTTMVDMIASLRAYETGQKAIQSIDETMQSNATSVGSVPA